MRRRVEEVVARPGCEAVAASWSAVVSEDLDSLGDNSPSVIASHQVRGVTYCGVCYLVRRMRRTRTGPGAGGCTHTRRSRSATQNYTS